MVGCLFFHNNGAAENPDMNWTGAPRMAIFLADICGHINITSDINLKLKFIGGFRLIEGISPSSWSRPIVSPGGYIVFNYKDGGRDDL